MSQDKIKHPYLEEMACIIVQMISERNRPQTSLALAPIPKICFCPGAE